MAPEHQRTMTVAGYFQLEENDPEHRYEYIDGSVYMMAGVHSTMTPSNQMSRASYEHFCVEVSAVSIVLTRKYRFLKHATSILMSPSHVIHKIAAENTWCNLPIWLLRSSLQVLREKTEQRK